MKEPDWKICTEEELWKYVATHLAKNKIETVLVGGAVAAIYSEGAYRSGDLDLVLVSSLTDRLPKLMKEIGFEVKQSRHYSHPKCKHLIVDFASPPAAIGEDYKIIPAKVKSEGTIIKLYSPTDCIRDRLSSYIHFKARECLDQAVLVAKRQRFNASKIKSWCESEGSPQTFMDFQELLKKTK